MGATAARDIISVSSTHAVVNDPLMGQITLSINDLPRTELMRAASIRFPQSGVLWRNFGNDVIATAINTGDLPTVPDPAVTDEFPLIEQVAAPTNGKVPNGDAAKLAELIRNLASSAVTTQVDESKVRSIVASSLADLIPQVAELITQEIESATANLRPHVTQITLPNLTTVELPGVQHQSFPDLVRILSTGLHAYLVGPPGTGKTYMAHQAATALGLQFAAISCSPTMPDSRLFGFIDASGTYRRTLFRDAYEYGWVFLFDEIDNSHPGILAAMNQSLANNYCAFPDGMVKRHESFRCVAAANTFGSGATRQFVGRNALDKATLDRFIFKVIGIDETLEESITRSILPECDLWLGQVREWRSNVESHKLEVIISPRAAFYGAKLLAAGFTMKDAKEMVVAKGMSDDERRKVFGG